VNTHHHIDHAGGLRTFIAEGATIVTHEINKSYYEKIAALPHTLNPDRLARTPRRPSFETFSEKKVLTDGTHVIELHHLRGNGHNAGLAIAYLPKEKILYEADAYNPPAQANAPVPTPVSPYTANLVETMKRLRLDVQTIIPVHYAGDNRKVTLAELMRVAQPPSTN
jgi:glyoxylase-like metal-dependent hydrolase (beta-lactamase superfamily II)